MSNSTRTDRAWKSPAEPNGANISGGRIVRLQLQGVQVIDRALRMGGSLEDVSRVVPKTA